MYIVVCMCCVCGSESNENRSSLISKFARGYIEFNGIYTTKSKRGKQIPLRAYYNNFKVYNKQFARFASVRNVSRERNRVPRERCIQKRSYSSLLFSFGYFTHGNYVYKSSFRSFLYHSCYSSCLYTFHTLKGKKKSWYELKKKTVWLPRQIVYVNTVVRSFVQRWQNEKYVQTLK